MLLASCNGNATGGPILTPTEPGTPETSQPKPPPTDGGAGVTGPAFGPLFIEQIPGSLNHSPDGTWWGYKQSKIARIGDTVFMFVIENDNYPSTESQFVLYKKLNDRPWEPGARHPTSRPGNIVVDSKGGLHALVFDPWTFWRTIRWAAWNTTISRTPTRAISPTIGTKRSLATTVIPRQ